MAFVQRERMHAHVLTGVTDSVEKTKEGTDGDHSAAMIAATCVGKRPPQQLVLKQSPPSSSAYNTGDDSGRREACSTDSSRIRRQARLAFTTMYGADTRSGGVLRGDPSAPTRGDADEGRREGEGSFNTRTGDGNEMTGRSRGDAGSMYSNGAGSEMAAEWFSGEQVARLRSLMFNYVQTDGNYLATQLPRELSVGLKATTMPQMQFRQWGLFCIPTFVQKFIPCQPACDPCVVHYLTGCRHSSISLVTDASVLL